MFSGKSLSLIKKTKDLGGSFECFKPNIDKRNSNFIASRGYAERLAANSIDNIEEIANTKADVVVIDEAQFFNSDGFGDVINFLRDQGKTVLIGGLDRIANGKYWNIYPIIVELADEVVRLSAQCNICGGEATYTKKLKGSDEDIQMEGEEVVFIPVCEECFRTNRTPDKKD
jgi:thymidine kinase